MSDCSSDSKIIRKPLSDAEKKLRNVLDSLGSEPSGPIYHGTHKQLADILFRCGKGQEALYHLCESHGSTLRNQTCSLIHQQLRKEKCNNTTLQSLKDMIGFEGKWHDGISGLYKRLAELPTEWTVVQLTLEWDPLSRFPPRNRDVNRGQGVYFSRFPCGGLSEKINEFGEGGQPFSIFLPALDEDEEQLSMMAAMRQHLSKMDTSNRKDRRNVHEECSRAIESTVKELQTWLGGWQCLLLGRLVSEKLKRAIKTAVDSIVDSCNIGVSSKGDSNRKGTDTMQNISEKTLNIFYLIASSPLITLNEVQLVSSHLVQDQKLANYLGNKLNEVKEIFVTALNMAERYPVVLLIDEELDILPFEVIPSLQEQSFTRMPSIHFLHAFHHIHKNSAVKFGIDTQKCYYVINPSKNLPQLETLFKSLSSSPVFKNWKGVFNEIPSKENFVTGLQENDLFLYCGHGGGNQFIPRNKIEQSHIKAVVFLFGCSSSSLDQLGGRVEMSSLSYSYLIAGSPSVVGMLWQVLDTDVNNMTEELIKVWCNPGETVAGGIDNLDVEFRNMKIDTQQRKKSSRDLSEAVCIARKRATRFLNRAAIVIRGLPVNAKCANGHLAI